jgi:hypothetical protein
VVKKIRYLQCATCGRRAVRRTNNQKHCDECRLNPPSKWRPYLCCEICEEVVPRGSNNQKYCDKCRQLGHSRTVAKYYKKHRKQILKRTAAYRAENRDVINAKQRCYHQDTKAERRTRAELREIAAMP